MRPYYSRRFPNRISRARVRIWFATGHLTILALLVAATSLPGRVFHISNGYVTMPDGCSDGCRYCGRHWLNAIGDKAADIDGILIGNRQKSSKFERSGNHTFLLPTSPIVPKQQGGRTRTEYHHTHARRSPFSASLKPCRACERSVHSGDSPILTSARQNCESLWCRKPEEGFEVQGVRAFVAGNCGFLSASIHFCDPLPLLLLFSPNLHTIRSQGCRGFT